MAKDTIRFKGLSLNRDEQSAEHGELSLCAGVELHDGSLRPSVLQGSTVTHKEAVGGEEVDVPSTFQAKVSGVDTPVTLLYVHETPVYRHFICSLGSKLYWFNQDGTVGSPLESGSHTPIHDFNSDIISIESVGNTLVVMDSSGVHYILWKIGDIDYKYLGTQIPFVELKFRPSEQKQGTYDTSTIPDAPAEVRTRAAWRALAMDADEVVTTENDPVTNKRMVYIKGDYRTAFTDGIWALINQTNSTIAKDGHFYAPFILRYCYRLYDGSMVMHSAPIFMNVSSDNAYRVCFENAWYWREGESGPHGVMPPTIWVRDDTWEVHDGDVSFLVVDSVILSYTPNNVGIRYSSIGTDVNNEALNNLRDNWSDIVKSIDIFVSPMMVREKSGEQIVSARVETGAVGVRDSSLKLFKTRQVGYSYWYENLQTWDINVLFDIPMEEKEEYLQRIKDCSTFYKIKSLDIEGGRIGTNGIYIDLDYDKNVVANISTNEMMKDDYHTHNTLAPIPDGESGLYVYNHRVNLYGMKEMLFSGFNILTMVNEIVNGSEPYDYYSYPRRIRWICVELSTEQGKLYVKKDFNFTLPEMSICKSLLFYPDKRASKIMICDGDWMMYTFKMEPCNFLNGSMATEMFYKTTLSEAEEISSSKNFPIDRDSIFMPNKILSSEVDDPYFFPVEGRNSVGNGAVKGVAAVTRALSQGQVGDHDLMVFSTDGIWALKVSSEGTYMAMHNISREVCSNPKSICQLDQSVLFATERNLVQLWESDMRSLSEVLDGPLPDWEHVLPSLYAAFPANGTEAQQVIHRLLEQGTPAVTMFNNGRLFYDHASARVVVLPEDTSHESVAMVYSLRDEAWSTMPIPAIRAVVPGYPSPFMQLGDSTVMILDKPYDYAGGEEVAAIPGMIITRTLTFSDTMDVIRGYTQYGDSTLASTLFIYGSNDQRNWQALGTTSRWFYNYLPGKPFRFFRIAIYLQMKPSEEYQQLEVEVVNKYAKL